jgi:hypothetical protein
MTLKRKSLIICILHKQPTQLLNANGNSNELTMISIESPKRWTASELKWTCGA